MTLTIIVLNYYNKNGQNWATTRMGCFRQMFICNGKTSFCHPCNQFINANRKSHVEQGYSPTPLYFIWKWLNFLLITCTFYFIKYFKNFLFSPSLAYWNRLLKLPIERKIFSKNGYSTNNKFFVTALNHCFKLFNLICIILYIIKLT